MEGGVRRRGSTGASSGDSEPAAGWSAGAPAEAAGEVPVSRRLETGTGLVRVRAANGGPRP